MKTPSSILIVALVISVILLAIAITLMINGDSSSAGTSAVWYETSGGMIISVLGLGWLCWALYRCFMGKVAGNAAPDDGDDGIVQIKASSQTQSRKSKPASV